MLARLSVGWCAILAAGLAVAGGAAPGEPTPAARRHRVDLDSHLKITPPGQAKPMTMDIRLGLRYRIEPHKKGIVVTIDEMEMKTTGDGVPPTHSLMTHDRYLDERGLQKTDNTREDALPAIRTMLDTFGAPLAEVALDGEGGEVGRTPRTLTGPLAQPGTLDLTRAYHVRFPKDKDRWEAPVVLPQAQGQVARGMLAFEKLPRPEGASADAPVRVKVSGTLGSGAKMRGYEVRDFSFRVTGEQVFDLKVRDWSSAAWDVVMSWVLVNNSGQPIGSASGTMTLTMKRIDPPPPGDPKGEG
jgi:hypothetical protein